MKSPLYLCAMTLMGLCTTSFFLVPALMSWNVIPASYMDGFLLIELGLVLHAMFLLLFNELPK